MPAKIEPRSGMYYNWDLGESGWNNQMDANLLKLGAVSQLGIKSRALAIAPPAPDEGDMYIIADGATGAWAGRKDQVAVAREGAIWEFYEARMGWVAYIEDEGVLSAYKLLPVPAWSTGVAI